MAGKTPGIAFLDLLGTTYYAETNPALYHHNLSEFIHAIKIHSPILKNTNGKVYIFSDCAYASSDDAETLCDYLSLVRRRLLTKRLYIQAAVEPGSLTTQVLFDEKDLTKDAKAEVEIQKSIVSGTVFSKEVASVYAKQHSLKGAAIRISTHFWNQCRGLRRRIVKSVHLPNPNNSTPECFWDLKYGEADISEAQLEHILSDCLKAKASKRSAGGYYVSVLVSMVRSVNWRAIEPRLSKKKRGAIPPAELLFDLFVQTEFARQFGDLRGFEYVYFSMLDEIYRQCEHHTICGKIRAVVAGNKRLLLGLERVPHALLEPAIRHKFLDSTLSWTRRTDNTHD